jgi:hypothetical protein
LSKRMESRGERNKGIVSRTGGARSLLQDCPSFRPLGMPTLGIRIWVALRWATSRGSGAVPSPSCPSGCRRANAAVTSNLLAGDRSGMFTRESSEIWRALVEAR